MNIKQWLKKWGYFLIIPLFCSGMIIVPELQFQFFKWANPKTTGQLFCSRGLNIVEGEVESPVYSRKVDNALDFIYLVETLSKDKTTIRDQISRTHAKFWIFENQNGAIIGYYFTGVDY